MGHPPHPIQYSLVTSTGTIKNPLQTADPLSVGDLYLDARLAALRAAQNPDGGWGYFPGKQSWLEPTFYATLALHGEPAADRAWALVSSWQTHDGYWRPSADVEIKHWSTALGVTLATVRNATGAPLRKAVEYLLSVAGAEESSLLTRAVAKIGMLETERNFSLKGWPWKPGTSSWVEPTAHTLVALKKASAVLSAPDVSARVRSGEAQLLDVRGRDGGWNYGSRSALGIDLPTYPETTALALLGLQSHAGLSPSLDIATRMLRETSSPMARAWLTIALRLHAIEIPGLPDVTPSSDILITALEALGSGENYRFLKTGVVA